MMLVKILRHYQRALDQHEPQAAFLALWQVLEEITVIPANERRQDRVLSRISSLLSLEPFFADVLRLSMTRRNELVHSGLFPESDDKALFTLKPFVDASVAAFLRLSESFSSIVELQEFFTHIACNNRSLCLRRDVIDFIQRTRLKET